MALGTIRANMATAITRLRPSTSAATPQNGAVNATARVEAMSAVLICTAPTANSCDMSGSTDWGA